MAMFSAIASAVCSNMPNCKFNWMATCFGSNAEDNRVVVEDGAFSVDNHTTTFIKCCVTEVHQSDPRRPSGRPAGAARHPSAPCSTSR